MVVSNVNVDDFKDSPLGLIPKDWETVKIDELGSIYSGGTPRREVSGFWQGTIAWVTPSELSGLKSKYLTKTKEYITQSGLQNSSASLMPSGTLLITTRATIGLVAISSIPITTNQGFKSIIFNQWICSSFYYYFLRFIVSKMIRLAVGSTFNEISKKDFSSIIVPLPSLPEQQKIAGILDTLDETIIKTEQIIEKLQKMKAGLLHDLLTRGIDENGNLRNPVTHPEQFKDSPLGLIPKEWEVVSIEEKLEKVIDYRGKTPKKTTLGISLITAKNVRNGYLDPEPREFIHEKDYNNWMRRGIPKAKDILFTTEAPLGNVAQVPAYKVALAQRLLTLIVKTNELDKSYLFWLLHWSNSRRKFEKMSTGSTVLGIKQSVFCKVLFCFPPLTEQKRIAETLETFDTRIQTEQTYLAKLKQQKQGLMHDLLTGKVRVIDLIKS